MGRTVQLFFVTDWPYLIQPRPGEEAADIITNAANYLFEVECGYSMGATEPAWCHELPIPCLRFSNWKATFWAGEYYEKAVRPLLADKDERVRADRVLEAFLWVGNDDNKNDHNDFAFARGSSRTSGLFFSFAPGSVDCFFTELSALVCGFEAMDLPANALASGANDWYPSADVWIRYLNQWVDVFEEASKKRAGLLALAE